MKIYTRFPIVLAAVLLAFSSCLSDSDVTETNNRAFISSFSVSTLPLNVKGVTSEGKDTTYISTMDASRVVFTIDHRDTLIENRDSLPTRIVVDKVIPKISYVGSGMTYRKANAWDDDPWKPYQSGDTIDFTTPMHFMVYATDASTRKYTIRMNIHRMEPDSLFWNEVPADSRFAQYKSLNSHFWQGRMLVFGTYEDGSIEVLERGLKAEDEWKPTQTSLPAGADVSTLVNNGSYLFLGATDGSLWASADGLEWESWGQQPGMRLVGVSDKYIYAIIAGSIWRHGDSMTDEWMPEMMDDEPVNLPTHSMSAVCYKPSESALRRIVLVGSREAEMKDTCAVVWSKAWLDGSDVSADRNEEGVSWMYHTPEASNRFKCPDLSPIKVISYGETLLAVGGKSQSGRHEALDGLYVSKDNGISWRSSLDLHLPAGVKGSEGAISIAMDPDKFLWVFAKGKVWRGRLNSLGFDRK